MKTYAITKTQLRSVIKEAFWSGFEAARKTTKEDAWDAAELRKEIDHHGLLERLEASATTLVTK